MIPQLQGLTREQRRDMIRQLRKDNRGYPPELFPIPAHAWPQTPAHWKKQLNVWRSQEFLVQLFDEVGGVFRLSINRTDVVDVTLEWREDISWDDLQRLKREAGYGEREAVEVFPPDAKIVNVANMRHLWILPARLPFSWGD